MEAIIWILVIVVVAAAARSFGAAQARKRYERGSEHRSPALDVSPDVPSDVRHEVRHEKVPPRQDGGGDQLIHSALAGMRRYLEGGVETPLRKGLEGSPPELRTGAEDAVTALEDLYFYLRPLPESRSTEDLNELAREAGGEYRQEWDVELDVHVPERPTTVDVNREAFLDALYLVLHNAGTFGEGREVEVVVRYQEGDCWLVVRDRGTGFGAAALEHAFDPFFTSGEEALGLGLYQARRIIQAMGGSMAVRNRPRGGAQVEIVLPSAGE